MTILAVAVAGALGAAARYWVTAALGVRAFPWVTLGINVGGSFLLGFVLGGPGATRLNATVATAVTVGFLGAFTTFSTFSFEVLTLLKAGRHAAAAAYLASSVFLGVVAASVGYSAAQRTL